MSPFKLHPEGVTVNVRLTPGAKACGFHGLMDMGEGKAALKVSVNAIPGDGKANKALIAFLAENWGVPKSRLGLLSGEANRQKVVLVRGDGAALMGKLKI
jgi:uncharacterized protein (TIGR00251 family)